MAGALDDYEVHPLAAIFPMLSDEELAELAADIKENGQLHPIICTVDGKLIVDGRNRFAACKIAGVEPWFENRICSEEEARALIVSANLQRRNMSKSQQAMAHAMIYPKPGTGLETKPDGVHKTRLSQARAVLRAAPDDLALQVLAGPISIDVALAEILKRVSAANSDTTRAARLHAEAPDKGGRGIKRSSETDGVSATRLKLARTVLRHDPNLAAAILSGTGETLDHAYEIVKKRQQETAGIEARLARLEKKSPMASAMTTRPAR